MKKMMMTMAALMLTALAALADDDKKFSPAKFQAELEQYVTREAELTADEAARFFPVYREMGQRQRELFRQQQQLGKPRPQGDDACRAAIEQSDRIDIEVKQLQQQYHRRFMELLPPQKVYRILKAENRFHRRALHQDRGHDRGKGHRDGKKTKRD